MSVKNPVEIDGATGGVIDYTPGKPTRYRAKLDSLQDVRREMAKVYRESRSGLIDAQDATKQVWMLKAIGEVIAAHEIEKRIEALENRQHEALAKTD